MKPTKQQLALIARHKRYRIILKLRAQGRTFAAIGKMIGISPSAVTKLYYRAVAWSNAATPNTERELRKALR